LILGNINKFALIWRDILDG